MALLTTTKTRVIGVQPLVTQTLTASDTIPIDFTKRQLLILQNTTAGALTATIDGADGNTVLKDGVGSINVAAGLAIAIPAGESRFVPLASIRDYCQGVVSITGGTGLKAVIFED